MQLPYQPHWLEQAIDEEREPTKIAQKIADHPEFRKMIEDSICFAQENGTEKSRETRVLVEHIVSLLHKNRSEDFRLCIDCQRVPVLASSRVAPSSEPLACARQLTIAQATGSEMPHKSRCQMRR